MYVSCPYVHVSVGCVRTDVRICVLIARSEIVGHRVCVPPTSVNSAKPFTRLFLFFFFKSPSVLFFILIEFWFWKHHILLYLLSLNVCLLWFVFCSWSLRVFDTYTAMLLLTLQWCGWQLCYCTFLCKANITPEIWVFRTV